MRFCNGHWGDLRNAVETKGMSHLIARSEKEAASRIMSEVEGQAKEETFDPLMSCHWMISSEVLKLGGLELLWKEHCPLCEVRDHTDEETVREWIDSCTTSVLKHCKEIGVLNMN
jgi:hypothetical protein